MEELLAKMSLRAYVLLGRRQAALRPEPEDLHMVERRNVEGDQRALFCVVQKRLQLTGCSRFLIASQKKGFESMKEVKRRWGRRATGVLVAVSMVLALIAPAFAQELGFRSGQTVTLTMEYTDESGQTEFYLPPTQVAVEEGDILLDVLQRGYGTWGGVTYSALYGFTVTPTDGQPVGEVGWGKKAWWPFINSSKVGNKSDVAAGDVIRFVYVQDNAQGIPGYVPPATEGGQGSLSINKDKLVSNLA